MKQLRLCSLAVTLLITFAACNSPAPHHQPNQQILDPHSTLPQKAKDSSPSYRAEYLEGEWGLSHTDTKAIVNKSVVNLVFTHPYVEATTGCSRITQARPEINHDLLRIIGSATSLSCDPSTMNQDQWLVNHYAAGIKILNLTDTELIFGAQDGATMTFTKKADR